MLGACLDVTAPVIVCPSSVEAETSRDESVGRVDWRVPAAVDNSGFQPTVTVIPALVPPVLLPIGNHTVTYTAEDGNKNKARCTFTITVRGLSQSPLKDKFHYAIWFEAGSKLASNQIA